MKSSFAANISRSAWRRAANAVMLPLTAVSSAAASQAPVGTLLLRPDSAFRTDGYSPGTAAAAGFVRVGPGGLVWVVDVPGERLIVLDSTGRPQLTRAGQMRVVPTGLRSPGPVGFLGDTVWVASSATQEVVLMSRDGAQFARFALPKLGRAAVNYGARFLLSDGSLLMGPEVIPAMLGEVPFETAMPRVRRNGAVVGSMGSSTYVIRRVGAGDAVLAALQRIGGPITAADATGTHVATAEPDTSGEKAPGAFTVQLVMAAGQLLYRRSYERAQAPLSAADRSSIAEPYRRSLAARYGPRLTDIDDLPTQLKLPDYPHSVTQVVVGRDGVSWIRHEARSAVTDWSIIGRSGVYCGTVKIPTQLNVHDVSASHVWATEWVAARRQTVIRRYRLTRATAPEALRCL